MAERVKAVNVALALVKQPVTAADVAKGFARVRAADVEEILETLCTMGHARRGQGEGHSYPEAANRTTRSDRSAWSLKG